MSEIGTIDDIVRTMRKFGRGLLNHNATGPDKAVADGLGFLLLDMADQIVDSAQSKRQIDVDVALFSRLRFLEMAADNLNPRPGEIALFLGDLADMFRRAVMVHPRRRGPSVLQCGAGGRAA